MADEVNEALKAAFKGALHDAADFSSGVPRLATGLVPVDHALGGGFGEGRMHEVFGSWSTGKTLILYLWMIYVQTVLGGKAILFESEGGFAAQWYQALGGILDPKQKNTLLYYPDVSAVEDVFEGIKQIVTVIKKTGYKGPVAIGWDSIAATGTKHLEKQGVQGSRDMTKAFQMDQGVKMIQPLLTGTRISLVATNQTRVKIGDAAWEETHTPGGRAFPYFSSARIELELDGGPVGSRITVGEGKDSFPIGRWVRGMIVKNKMSPPFRKFRLPIYTEAGHPHPTFPGRKTQVGVDLEEALLEWYIGNRRATFGDDAERYVDGGAAGRYKIHGAITGGQPKSFTKKTWPEVLAEFPQLRDLDPVAKPPPVPSKKGKK